MNSNPGTFIVELTTRQGRVCERYDTYAEARQRVEQFPPESVVGLAFIFQELADGSHRLVREDGKPLQFHREAVEDSGDSGDEPLPLVEDAAAVLGADAQLRVVEPEPQGDDWEDLPLA